MDKAVVRIETWTSFNLQNSENKSKFIEYFIVIESQKSKCLGSQSNHQSFYLELQSSHWIGTIILSTCELIERPSKKDGFCFKLFHPMDQSIWAARGPEGETMGAVVQPLPTSHLIFRAPNNAAGKCWMDALELALRCSSLLLRTMSSSATPSSSAQPYGSTGGSKLQRSHKNSHESNPDSSNITTFSE